MPGGRNPDRRDALIPVPGTTIALPVGELDRFRSSSAVLAWHLDRRSYTVATDLLGDDRPAERDTHYARTLAWLRGAGEVA